MVDIPQVLVIPISKLDCETSNFRETGIVKISSEQRPNTKQNRAFYFCPYFNSNDNVPYKIWHILNADITSLQVCLTLKNQYIAPIYPRGLDFSIKPYLYCPVFLFGLQEISPGNLIEIQAPEYMPSNLSKSTRRI